MSAEILRLRAHREDGPLSDEALAHACAAGDATAIGLLFDRYRWPVARYVHRLVGGGPDVEDIVQSTFLEVARGRTVYDSGLGRVSTWLFAIATNVVRHHRRSHARRARMLASVPDTPRSSDVATEADARRKLHEAERALVRLPDDLREAFVLCEVEGFSAAEASHILGASEATVWKRVSKARAKIRAQVLGSEA